MVPVCKNCGETTHMRKASAIVAEGTHASSGRGASFDPVAGMLAPSSYEGVVQTDLARRFTPPEAPPDSTWYSYHRSCLTSAGIVSLFWLLPIGVVAVVILLDGKNLPADAEHVILWLLLVMLWLLLVRGAWVLVRVGKNRDKAKCVSSTAAHAIACERWNRLWYCTRCDQETYEGE